MHAAISAGVRCRIAVVHASIPRQEDSVAKFFPISGRNWALIDYHALAIPVTIIHRDE